MRKNTKNNVKKSDHINTYLILSALLVSVILGNYVYERENDLRNSDFELKESYVLSVFKDVEYRLKEDNIKSQEKTFKSGRNELFYNYTIIFDRNNDRVFDPEKDEIIQITKQHHMVPVQKGDHAVYIEKRKKGKLLDIEVLALKANNNVYNVYRNPEDFFDKNYWKKNESFRQAINLFYSKYANQK